MEALRSLGTHIRAAREAKNWSQEHLAAVLSRGRDTVGAIERAEQAPSLDTLLSLIRVLELDPVEVILMLTEPKAGIGSDRVVAEAEMREIMRRMDVETMRKLTRIGRVMME